MHISINKADIVRELSLALQYTERKTTIPVLGFFLLEASADNTLRITGTDLNLSTVTHALCNVREPGRAVLHANRLTKLLSSIPDGAIDIKVNPDNHWASIKAGGTRARIPGMPPESFPELPAMPETAAALPVSVLSRLATVVIPAISEEESRFTLNGALMELNGSVRMVSTNGHRLNLITSPTDTGYEYRCIVPRRALVYLSKLPSVAGDATSVEFAHDENHLFFQTGNRLLISRRLTGNFPDYARVLPKEMPGECVFRRDELRTGLATIMPFLEDDLSKTCRLHSERGSDVLTVKANSTEAGECEVSVPTEGASVEIDVALNSRYLADFLAVCPDDRVRLRFRNSQSAIQLETASAPDGEELIGVVMPMRV